MHSHRDDGNEVGLFGSSFLTKFRYTTPMKTLHIYPTSRAIRAAKEQWQNSDTLVPTFMRMDAFEQQAVVLGKRAMIDPLQRVLLLREAANFEDFEVFKVDRVLVKFLSRSDGLFRFFEELSQEGVSFERLAEADAYAEFGEHLAILAQLKARYGVLLEARGLTDRMFVPEQYRLHEGFVAQFERIEIFLEGLLSRFELELLEQIATHAEVILHYTTSPFSAKMEGRLAAQGITLAPHAQNEINLNHKTHIHTSTKNTSVSATVYAVSERFEQIAEAMVQIEGMVSRGIAPERIALILPDESFKEAFRLYDRLNNLNFAMGFDYANGRNYKVLSALADHWRLPDAQTTERLQRYGMAEETYQKVSTEGAVNVGEFFKRLSVLELSENDPLRIARVAEAHEEMLRLFPDEWLPMSGWLSLWMQKLSTIRIDDLRGGMITVMGVLETRGVAYDGVVIVDFNDGIVPATTAKDQFLNSQVRAFADLPTRSDREALQKYYYHRLLSQAHEAVILYTTADDRLPSKFLYELGIESGSPAPVPLGLLYDQPVRLVPESDPIVESFDPTAQTWSASRLKIWLSCKRRYYYQYIRGIESKPDPEFNEGAFLHTLLDHLYRDTDHYDSPEVLRRELYRLMDVLLPDETPKIAYLKVLWKQRLEPFIAQQIAHSRAGWRVAEREREFEGTIHGLRFKGRIDRIDQDATHTLVIDYKSGSITEANRSKNLEKVTDFQMNIYRHLLAPRYGNLELAFQTIVTDGALHEARVLNEKEAYLEEHLLELKTTRSFIAQKTETLSQCTYCPYALMCGR